MTTPAMRTAQMLALSFMSMLVVLGVVVAVGLPWVDLRLPPLYVVGGQIVAGIVLFAVSSTLGFRVEPIEPGTDPERAKAEGLGRHQSSMFLRLALGEVIAIISLVLAFVRTEGQLMTYIIGGVISLVLMGLLAYPSARNIRRVEERLDSAGGRSGLSQTFGVGDGPMSTHQVL